MISDVNVGDSVLAVDEKGTLQFSQVVAQLNKDQEMKTRFHVITTKGGRNMTLTPKHLIYKAEDYSPHMSSKEFVSSPPIFAMTIEKGDFVFVLDGNKKMIKDEVVSNDIVIRKGVYSPVTSLGNIIVEDILASCYSGYDHQMTHLVLAPLRWLTDAQNFLARMTSIEKHDSSEHENEHIGTHWYQEGLLDIVNNLLLQYKIDKLVK